MTAAETLSALGFTDTEALVYCALLKGGAATGYRLAQACGKAPANTYQALTALVQKGAAVVDDGGARTFRAAPAAELLAAMERGFEARKRAAAEALEKLAAPAADERVYQIKSPAQVMERARAMIAGAAEIVLFDLFPGPLEALKSDLQQAALRGVQVAGLTYGESPALPFPCVVSQGAALAGGRWPGQQVGVVADGREYLMALLSHDGADVLRGVWSDGGYLACMQHNGLASEIRLSALPEAGADPLARLSLLNARPRGLRDLLGPEPADAHQEGTAA